MQYTVVHSTDPYLLARLATDLQMEGYTYRPHYPKIQHPFFVNKIGRKIAYSDIYPNFYFNFQSHACICYPTRHELTSRNYIKVLTQILEPCLTTS